MQIASKILCLHAINRRSNVKIFDNKSALSAYLDPLRKNNLVGLVPTMGALHEGHLSLVKKGLTQNDVVIISIFVNPTQFDNSNDLENYPRTLAADEVLLTTLGVENIVIYAPSVHDIYNDRIVSKNFDFGGLEDEMEGAFRKGHFDGVGTIVERLFEIVKPNNAYFGEKDYQQLQIIKKLVEITDMNVNIVGCSIKREKDGLAMSSRNVRLKPNYREAAPFIYKTLKTAKEKFGTKSARVLTNWVIKQFEKHPMLNLEYFIIADATSLKELKRKSDNNKYRAFIAVYADDVRLIDNIALN